jgi:hypothetical protein
MNGEDCRGCLNARSKYDLKMCEALNVERRARGLKPVGDPAKLAKKKADFEKAYYGKLRHSEKGRRAVDVLRAKIWDDCARSNSQRAGITNPKGERTA